MRSILLLVLTFSFSASATVYITVSGANVKRAKIAVGKVHPLSDNRMPDPSLANNVQIELRKDLEFSNIFEFQSDSSFINLDTAKDVYNMKYEDWTPLGVAFVVKMGYRIQAGKLTVEAILYDVPGQKKIFGTRYQYASTQYHRLVHTIAEDIIKELTGERGLFFSRILMVCRDLKKRKNPPKEIYLVEPDGRNLTQVTFDNTLSLTPSWANDGKHITYTQFDWRVAGGYRKKLAVLKKHNLKTGDRSVLSARDGMNSGAAWNPKGDKFAATLSFTGRPEIYLMDPSGKGDPEPLSRNIQWKRISGDSFQANNPNLLFDVEPSWSPDGTQLTFSSARTGHPMIYVVNLATKIANQLTFAGQYNASPSWSPKGDKILFSAQRTAETNFDIYMIDPDGNNLSRMTVGDRPGRKVNSENASWAPTGRHFAFGSNEDGNYAIYVMTADATEKRRISPMDKECATPAWGPSEAN